MKLAEMHNWLRYQACRKDHVGELARVVFFQEKAKSLAEVEGVLRRLRANIRWGISVSAACRQYQDFLDEMRQTGHSASMPVRLATDSFEFNLEESVRFHEENVNMTPWQYVHLLHERIRQSVAGKSLIYLDTNYWIGLRKAIFEGADTGGFSEMYTELKRLRSASKIICVSSCPLYMEVNKQSDDTSRRRTAELIDELSDNICLVSHVEGMKLELKDFLFKRFAGASADNRFRRYLTRPSWIINGVHLESLKRYPGMQAKLAIDLQSVLRFSDVGEFRMPFYAESESFEWARALKEDGAVWLSQGLKFDDIKKRLLGCFTYNHRLNLKSIGESMADEAPELLSMQAAGEQAQQMYDVKEMPHVQVLAHAFAALIENRRAEYILPNDIIDMEHATMALPICDVLFLDQGGARMMNYGRNSICQKHGKVALGSVQDAVTHLRALSS